MDFTSDPESCLILITRLVAVGVVMGTLEWLWNWRLLQDDDLLGWPLLRKCRNSNQWPLRGCCR